MNERLLQFIWQFQYFHTTELLTTEGESLHVYFPGYHNTNQGPDFTDGKIKIGSTTWAGTIELHIKTSDWIKHKHQEDKNYRNVILHVVWEDDANRNDFQSIQSSGHLTGPGIPVFELQGRVPALLLQRYEELMNTGSFIPCEKSISQVKDITWKSWKDRLLAERLIRKSAMIETCLEQTRYHWEETFWWLLARNFGMKVNADAFEAMARSIPVNILARHKNQVQCLEALLFGQAGLLEINPRKSGVQDDYLLMLQKEYAFYKKKHRLQSGGNPVFFLRMRPGNFPTIRLAQLAMLVHVSAHLFAKIKEAPSVKHVRKWFDVTANDYWHYHYRFGEVSAFKKKKPGAAMIDNVIINTVVPALFAYGHYHRENQYKEKALEWLERTGAEKNSITNGFQQLGIENKTAFDSQALIELKNEYCAKKRCLECGIGNAILKN